MKRIGMSFIALLVMVLLLVAGLNALGSRWRLDLTEQQLFTLSDATQQITGGLERPIRFELYFSRQAAKDLLPLRAYAQRVEELLAEYQLLAADRIEVVTIDPAPFSEQQDQAAGYGLQAVPVSNFGDELFFGLVVSRGEKSVALPFLRPEREAFLEYDITQLVYRLQQQQQPRVAVLTSLALMGGLDRASGRPTSPWLAIEQLRQQYQLTVLPRDVDSLAEYDVLLIVQPPKLAPRTQYAIDQFALSGGRILLFIDPAAESAQGEGQRPYAGLTTLQPLLNKWGLVFNTEQVVLDAKAALVVSQGSGRPPLRHLGLLAMGADNLAADDVVSAQLENINLASAGFVQHSEGAQSRFAPWIVSSEEAQLIDATRLREDVDLLGLQRLFSTQNSAVQRQVFTLAARVSGVANSAFPQGLGGQKIPGHKDDTDQLALVVFADTDLLTDRLWVQVQNFFGQRVAQPWADNGALLSNLLDQMSGSAELINLRARGQFSRPFSQVEELRRKAEARFLDSEQQLQQELQDIEAQLAQLRSPGAGQGIGQSADQALTLTPDQQQAVLGFQQQKLNVRKQLRAVQHELNKDIETLEWRLKALNIFIFPVLLTILCAFIALVSRRRQQL